MKMFAAAAVAAVLTLGATATQAAPAVQEVVAVSPAKIAVARRNVDAVTAAQQRTTALMDILNDPGFRSATTAEQYVAAIEAMTPRVEAARAELRTIAARIQALPSVAGPGDPVQLQTIDVMTRDISVSIGRLDDLLGSITGLGAALKAGDTPAVERALATLAQGMMLTIDGQATMFRGRVVLSDPQSTVYSQTMAMACLYDSFAAITRGQLEFLPVGEASAKSEAALDCVRTHVAGGREALVREAADPAPNAAGRAMQARIREISSRMLDEMANAERGLNTATVALKAGGGEGAIDAGFETFRLAERAIAQLANEQMAAATAR